MKNHKRAVLVCGRAGVLCLVLSVLPAGCGGSSDDAEAAAETQPETEREIRPETRAETQPVQAQDMQKMQEMERMRQQDAAGGDDTPSLMLSNFAGTDFTPVRDEAAAVYRLDRSFVENMMIIKAMPTYDQGMGLAAEDTPLDRYTFNYYRLDDDSLAFSVGAIVMSEEPSQWAWDGAGVWYDKRGLPTAKGNFDAGKLDGAYERFDDDGNVVETVMYDKGEAYDPNRFAADVYEPLVGTWHSDTVDGGITKRLVNVLRDDGTLTIYTQTLIRASFTESGYMESSSTDPTECAWVFKPDTDNPSVGMMEYYIENELLGRSRVDLSEPGVMASRAVYHKSPSVVGTRWRFVKVDDSAL